jgi:hypothetical protein
MNALQNEFHTVDVEFANYQRNNPNMDNPYARLLTAILMSAIHDAVAAQSSAPQRRHAWEWLEGDNCLKDFCLAVIRVDQEPLLRRLKYMRDNNINLKNMYTKREQL